MNFLIPIVIVILFILSSIRQINQYERGVKFQLGKYLKTIRPGWRLVFPIIQHMEKVDIRVKVIDVPDQDAITKDNVSVNVNAVLYYKVIQAETAILEVEDFEYAVAQLAQTTMRDVVGEIELDGLLAKRDVVSDKILQIVDKATDPWGIKIVSVDLKHIELPEDMKRTIAKQAEAEREKRAVIIKAEGEVMAAENMSKAANILSSSTGALHLRTLQSINDISSDKSNTVVFALPLEVLRAIEKITQNR
ncbi:slipin family protein [Candidatus Parcubacteria bacterium]|nr:slipin family protein [Candidatus Parcubacteria bacterium]